MSLEKVKGLPIHSSCPSCKEGRLVGVWNTMYVPGDTLTPGRAGYSYEVLERLGCNTCFHSFEAEDRGKSQKQIHKNVLTSFQNPDACPEHCPVCGCTSVQFKREVLLPKHWRNEIDAFSCAPASRPPFADPNEKKTYQYCANCNTVVFVLPTDPEEMKEFEKEKRSIVARVRNG
ncbi:hypothetical protein HYV70_03810 [Candidatus Uhrbacteria bacterium]|nr:hypothetical protein [Candidatus Uhrbacteria bacterium]